MLYIESDSFDPHYNLALEEYLFFSKQTEVFMLWQNNSSIIVGKNQNTMAEIDYPYVTQHNIPVVRRLSGGGAVYHDKGNLNFTYIVNRAAFGDFVGFTQTLRDYIATLGIDAAVSGRNDVLADGKKISGNAQYLHKGRLLHHGTVLIGADMSHLAGALRPDKEKIASKGIQSVQSRVGNLADMVPITAAAFRSGFGAYVRKTTRVTPYKLTHTDKAAVEKLCAEKYDTYDWNFGYSPQYAFHTKHRFAGGGVEVFMDIQGGIIRDVQIYGDFLANADPLAEKIKGTPHDADSLRKLLCGETLGTVTAAELLTCFL